MEQISFLAGSEKKFFDFVSKLTDKDKIALISHNDADGIASAVIASKVMGNLEYVNFIGYKPELLKPVVPELKARKINKVIFTDLSIGEREISSLNELTKFAEVLIIDHHLFLSDLNSDKITFMKSRDEFPASYMCYYLFSKIQKIEGWIAAIGTAADRVDLYHNSDASRVFEDFGLGEASKTGYFWKYVMNLGYALIYFKGKEKEVYDILVKAGKIEDLDVLDAHASEVQKELDFHLNEFEKKHEEMWDLHYYLYKPHFSINSMLINAISTRDRTETYIVVADNGAISRISARRQDRKIDCVALLKNAIEGLPNSEAGGHMMAAGANIPSEFLGKFKENLFKAYGNLKVG